MWNFLAIFCVDCIISLCWIIVINASIYWKVSSLTLINKTIHQWQLTHRGLMKPCGDINLCQHWLRQLLVARNQPNTWTKVGSSHMVLGCNYLSKQVSKNVIHNKRSGTISTHGPMTINLNIQGCTVRCFNLDWLNYYYNNTFYSLNRITENWTLMGPIYWQQNRANCLMNPSLIKWCIEHFYFVIFWQSKQTLNHNNYSVIIL